MAELETQILIAQRRHYLSEMQASTILAQADEVGRILSGLINSLKQEESKRDTSG